MGWSLSVASSSNDNDFNYDFHVTVDEAHPEYNYRPDYYSIPREMKRGPGKGEAPGLSVFVREGDNIYLHLFHPIREASIFS